MPHTVYEKEDGRMMEAYGFSYGFPKEHNGLSKDILWIPKDTCGFLKPYLAPICASVWVAW
jgi:hypothetical protein